MQTIVLAAPIDTRSGYGVHSRLLAKSLLNFVDRYDVRFMSLPWGSTQYGALDPNTPDEAEILARIVPQLTYQPDIWIQCTIPPEFQPIGKVNIGITAGIETTLIPNQSWFEGCNRMNVVIAPSKHSVDVLSNCIIEQRNNQTNQVVGQFRLTKPIETLFEGLDTATFNRGNVVRGELVDTLNAIPENFCFLTCGMWMQGMIGADRKNISMTVHTFLKTWMKKGVKNRPALILKTNGAGYSIMERDQVIDKIWQIKEMIREQDGFRGEFPSIYLLNGELSDAEMNTLYRHQKIKALVSFTSGEGWGLPLMEFASTGKPVVASAWSGHLDFLHPDHHVLLPGKLVKVDPSSANEWISRDAECFQVNYTFASQVLKNVYEHYEKYLERSRKSPKYLIDNFSLTKMSAKFLELLEKYSKFVVNDQPEQKRLKLPKLDRSPAEPVAQAEPLIKLPKLTKLT